MLARRLPTILPAMTLADAPDTTRIHGAAGRTTSAPARERQRIAGAYREGATGGSC